ncbi:MAG: hypothetical protein ABW134_20610 [Candidatus Thiodiazotropha endolucinida]
MRTKRKAIEDFFIQKFMDFFRTEIDEDATEIPEVTDKPDLAISSQGRVIGVELSQFPSSYIIKNFHKKIPPPTYTKNEIKGYLSVYPFEPHRWVHRVLVKKCKKFGTHKKHINSDEMWLVMHCHSIKDDWPMSDALKEGNREAEALLMRFGANQYRSNFERLFYIYADGTVVSLTGGSELIPFAVTLPDGVGYPAVTAHQFSFSCDVPLPGLGDREYQFEEIQFDEMIVAPMDDWMAEREPEIERPKFTASARVDSDRIELKIFRDGVAIYDSAVETSDKIGKTMYMHFLLQWSIKKTTFAYNA